MELGALVCTARSPGCAACPLGASPRADCAWRAAGFPADVHAARRRTQPWAGTDRQIRGRIMAALRDATGPVGIGGLAGAARPDAPPGRTQLDRCLASLIADGLIEQVPPADGTGPAYRLPA
jgi:A/G-specific adenine glycosylase